MIQTLSRTAAFALIGAALFCSSCGEKKTAENNTHTDTLTVDTVSQVPANDPQILSALPPVSELPAMLQLTGADFNPSLVNPATKAESYATTTDKAALNLGVYSTDIGYLAVYNKTQDIINHVKSTEKLAGQVGVTQVFGSDVQKRFESNLGKKDSLIKIVNESMKTANDYLKNNDRSHTAALVATGTFIEGLYIATQLVEKYPKDLKDTGILTNLIQTVISQKKSLADLLDILKKSKQEATVTEYTKHLEDLYKVYEDAKLEEKIKENKGDLRLTDKSIGQITSKVKEIRSKIVG